jgi:hypothetical protein
MSSRIISDQQVKVMTVGNIQLYKKGRFPRFSGIIHKFMNHIYIMFLVCSHAWHGTLKHSEYCTSTLVTNVIVLSFLFKFWLLDLAVGECEWNVSNNRRSYLASNDILVQLCTVNQKEDKQKLSWYIARYNPSSHMDRLSKTTKHLGYMTWTNADPKMAGLPTSMYLLFYRYSRHNQVTINTYKMSTSGNVRSVSERSTGHSSVVS